MSDILLAVVSFLIVLGPLVLIHEFGHFIAARMVGVTVLEFGLGFPPRAAKLFEQGGTLFTLNWLPIGGFVRPLGEDFVKPVSEAATDEERVAFEKYQEELAALGKKRVKVKSLMEAGPWQRIFFMAAGAIMNFIAAFAILVIVGMLGQPAPTVAVLGVAPGSPAETAKLQYGDEVVSINGLNVSAADVAKDALKANKGKPLDVTVRRNGQTIQTTLNPSDVYPPDDPGVPVLVIDTAEGSPAAEVFKEGDLIIEFDGVVVRSQKTLVDYIKSKAGEPIQMTFMRGGERITKPIVPRANPPDGQGPLGISIQEMTEGSRFDSQFGISLADAQSGTALVKASLADSISQASTRTLNLIYNVAKAPIDIITSRISLAQAKPVGPVGIARIGSQYLQKSIQVGEAYPLLTFAAVISIALGVTNLLPIPGLDGGRILFVFIELIRRKPMAPEREGFVHMMGLFFLLALVALLVISDLSLKLPQIGK